MSPVDYIKLRELLLLSSYDRDKTEYLVDGFKNGFDLGYRGPEIIRQTSPNLKFTIGNSTELWNKVMKEVELKRYAGPFKEIPFENFIQSPIGLVPKDKGKKTRLIFHPSYPRNTAKGNTAKGSSVNGATPSDMTTVQYPDFNDAIKLCIKAGKGCAAAKSDMSSAFRHLPMNEKFWKFLVMKAKNPDDGKTYYFVDKCMPFGASISCRHFQEFSNAVSHIVTYFTRKDNINYLDDYFFADIFKNLCNNQVSKFLWICDMINFPVALEKTVYGTTQISFLGLLIDTWLQKILIPVEKVVRALEMIDYILNRHNNKIKLKNLQKLTGFLNFLGKAIVPGRAFTRRLYAYTKGILKPNHHLYVTKEMKMDLNMWKCFLNHSSAYSRDFADFDTSIVSEEISMYSDASANKKLGCGGYSENQWFILQWEESFIETFNPSINYLELYAVTIAVFLWLHKYRNRHITLFCDNLSVVQMINNNSSKCKNCMVLIRLIVLKGLITNTRISAKHVPGKLNKFSDFLSRMQYKQFRKESRRVNHKFDRFPAEIPDELTPMEKLWFL